MTRRTTSEPEEIGKQEFLSPINLESTLYGVVPLSKKTKSVMTLYFNRDTTGYIEWDIPKLERTEMIGLEFEFDRHGKRTLIEYDGVFSLPKQAMDLLERHGVDVTEMRESLKDD